MFWIGLTGGIATGKSTVAGLLKSLGHPVLDADAIAHQALVQGSPVIGEIVKAFGKNILSGENVDRKKLGSIVFSDPAKRECLEQIVHPFVQSQVRKEREKLKNHEWVFYDVPLLYEKNLQDQFDAVIVVASSREKQIERLKKRNFLSDIEIETRLNSQLPVEEKVKKANFVIWNNHGESELKKELEKILKILPRP